MKLPSNETHQILKFFEYDHLPEELKEFSRPFHELAHFLVLKLDGPELDAGLRKLLESKDCCVRGGSLMADHEVRKL